MQHYVRVQVEEQERRKDKDRVRDEGSLKSQELCINRKKRKRRVGIGKHLLSETQTKAHKLTEKWKLFTRTQRREKIQGVYVTITKKIFYVYMNQNRRNET